MRTIWTVSELTAVVRGLITESEELKQVVVRGEVSNFSRPASGHLYFTLKDDKARLRVVMFSSKARYLRFQIKDGMSIIVQGSLDVFERSGDYQLYAESIQPDGVGALYLAYEQLKDRLTQEGLFSEERKRPLPVFPSKIALITSATGAAVRDMLTTLRRRYPLGHVLIIPVAVQGEDAPQQVANAIALASKERIADVLIVGRGGGSFEELYAFNTEVVVRAAAASSIPLVSAVGHETDTTILDFVADVRAATPTAAAELVSVDLSELTFRIAQLESRLKSYVESLLHRYDERLQRIEGSRALQDPGQITASRVELIDRLEDQLRFKLRSRTEEQNRRFSRLEVRIAQHNPKERLQRYRERLNATRVRHREAGVRLLKDRQLRLDGLIDRLALLSPLSVMSRGYAVVYRPADAKVITTINSVQPGDSVHVTVTDGWLDCQVWGVYEKGSDDVDGAKSGSKRAK